jgi:hypothetical protein
MAKVVRTYHDVEKTIFKEEYYEIDGKKEGDYKLYDENGQLIGICNYINGNIEGKYKDSNTNLKYNESRYIIWIILAIFVFLMLFRSMNSDDSNASTPLLVLALLVGLYVFLRK